MSPLVWQFEVTLGLHVEEQIFAKVPLVAKRFRLFSCNPSFWAKKCLFDSQEDGQLALHASILVLPVEDMPAPSRLFLA